jgi:hypothetical protein
LKTAQVICVARLLASSKNVPKAPCSGIVKACCGCAGQKHGPWCDDIDDLLRNVAIALVKNTCFGNVLIDMPDTQQGKLCAQCALHAW